MDQESTCIEDVIVGTKTPRSAPPHDRIGLSAHAYKSCYKHGVLLEIREGDLSDIAGIQGPNPVHKCLDPIVRNPPLDHWTPLMVLQRFSVSFQCKSRSFSCNG